jgi:hypothetical protein
MVAEARDAEVDRGVGSRMAGLNLAGPGINEIR